MRVEITFGGDSLGAVEASRMVVDSLQKLFLQSDETAASLREVKITTGQATESEINARRMQAALQGVSREARETRAELVGLQGTAANLRSFQIVGLAGLLGLGTAASGPVGAAAGGALVALPALLTSIGAGAGVAALAFHGMSGAIEGNLADFKKLNPEAQQFVQTIRSLDPWLKSLQADAQKGILPGADNLLHGLFSVQNAAAIQKAVTDIGASIGQVEIEFGKAFSSSAFTGGFADVMQHVAVWLKEDGDAALQFASAISKITIAGLPLDDWLVSSLDHGAKLFNSWVDGEKASGGLAHGMESMQHEMELVARLFESLVTAAFDLSKVLEPLGNNIIVDLTHGLQDFGHWLDQNRQQIDNVTEGALQALIGALKLADATLVPLGKTIYDVTQDTIGFHDAFTALLLAFAGFKVAGILTEIGLIGGAATAAEGEVGALRLGLLSLGAPEVLAAIGAAYGAFKLFQGDKTAGDTVVAGNPYIKGSAQYDAYAAGIAGTKAKGGQVQLPGGGRIPVSDPAYQKGLADGLSGTRSATTQNAPGGSSSGKQKMLDLAKSMIGTPYLWGGDTPGGFDCSGLVEWAFANGLDISLPRTTYGQVNVGTPVGTNTLKGATPGDVIFTQYGEGGNAGPGHEGIYVGNGQVLAAPHTGANVGVTSLQAFTGGGKYTVRDLSGQTVATIGGAAGSPGTTGAGSPFTTPPPFTTGLGKVAPGFGLPLDLQTAIDRAALSKGSADDLRAYSAAVDWIRKQISGGLKNTTDQPDLDAAYQLLSSYATQLQSIRAADTQKLKDLAAKAKFPGDALGRYTSNTGLTGSTWAPNYDSFFVAPRNLPARPDDLSRFINNLAAPTLTNVPASASSTLSASNFAANILKTLTSPNLTGSTTSATSIAQATKSFTDLQAALTPKIKALSAEIAYGTLSPESLALVRTKLDQYKTTITAGLQAARQAVAQEKTDFQTAFQSIGQAAISGLQNLAANYQSPASIVLAQLQQAHSDQQLQSALDQANQDLANALVPVPDSNTIVQNIQAILGQYQQANVIDQVQSAILGGKAQGVDGSSLLGQLNQAITAASAPDPTAVKQAQQEVADAQYAIQVNGLQKQADAQDQAYQDQISSQEAAINALDANWDTYYTSLKGNILDIGSTWAGVLASLGVPQDVITQALNSSAPVAVVSSGGGAAAAGAALKAQLDKTITGGAYGPGGPLQLHAAGGIAMRPVYRNVIGEAGPEAIIPLNDPRARSMIGGGGDTHVIELHGDFGQSVHAVLRTPGAVRVISKGLGKETANRSKTGAY